MQAPLHVPAGVGFAALEELEAVPWVSLRHAYGRGVTGRGIHDDVARSLRELAHDPDDAIAGGLYSNICHQGTVYEATAYAVPFLAAVAAGEAPLRAQLAIMLAEIALATRFETEDGCSSGALGAGVATSIRAALTNCQRHLDGIAAADPELASVMRLVVATCADPSASSYDALGAAVEPFW